MYSYILYGAVWGTRRATKATRTVRYFPQEVKCGTNEYFAQNSTRHYRSCAGFAPRTRRIIRCKNMALYIRDCVSLCLSDKTLKAFVPFHMVPMPAARGSKIPHQSAWKCVTCRGLHVLASESSLVNPCAEMCMPCFTNAASSQDPAL